MKTPAMCVLSPRSAHTMPPEGRSAQLALQTAASTIIGGCHVVDSGGRTMEIMKRRNGCCITVCYFSDISLWQLSSY